MKFRFDGLRKGWLACAAFAACLTLVAGCGAPSGGRTAAEASEDAGGDRTQVESDARSTRNERTVEDTRVANQTRTVGPAKGDLEPPSAGLTDLDRALGLAKHSLETLEKVKDYTGLFTKRELIGGELAEERDAMKVRHQPFSVYLRVIEPASSAGQEVIYVDGRNDGNLIAHTVGLGSSLIGRVSLDPAGMIAKRGNRYTIKDVGLKNLVKKLIDLGSRKELFRDSTVEIKESEFAERPCTQVEISSPRPVGDFRLATARIVIDRDWDVPVHYEAYEWPPEGEKPSLSETYSYYDLQFDVGLTDTDFDPDNPEYAFP
ncbi:MAG TPA: DUF1571 domain-containing protein [Pirellulales bacterium]|nr:DUF1571 domain-containing protein [Pirellulales bacterium]